MWGCNWLRQVPVEKQNRTPKISASRRRWWWLRNERPGLFHHLCHWSEEILTMSNSIISYYNYITMLMSQLKTYGVADATGGAGTKSRGPGRSDGGLM